MKTYVVMNDIQLPFHDSRVLEMTVSFVEEMKPHGIVLNGDVVDCYEISDYDRDPMVDADLDREIKLAGDLMARLARVSKERVWIGGNHEDRLRRYLWKNRDRFQRLGKRATGLVSEALDFPSLFRLSEFGFTWLPYGDYYKLGKLIVTHGTEVRKHSGWTAKSHFEKYGASVMIGHTHRLGFYAHTNLSGVHGAYENGCLCRLDPEYVKDPDWQQGFSIVHVDETTGFFNVQMIPILNRKLFFYGKEKYTV